MINLKELKKQGKSLKPIINIGKNGITDPQIEHIKRIILKKKLIKIKFNRSAIEEKEKNIILTELINKTNAVLIDFIGFNAVIYKDKK